MQNKIYPSSFALPVGRTTDAQYNSGCLRYLKFKSYIPSDFPFQKFPELYRAIGVIGEERVRQLLLDRYPESELIIEEPFKQEVDDDTVISGRCDFLLKTDDLIVEVKTTRSASVRSSVINKGLVPNHYLGQLVTYLVAFDKTCGELLVQYVHFKKDLSALGFVGRTFSIEIRDDIIYIDNDETEHTVGNLLSFYEIYRDALIEDKIPPRPITNKACYFCPFQAICDNMQQPQTTKEFKEAIHSLEFDFSKKPKPATLPRHDIRLKKK